MDPLNLFTVALALGSGLALGKYLWPAVRRRDRDGLMNSHAETARLTERLAAASTIAEERARAVNALEARLGVAIGKRARPGSKWPVSESVSTRSPRGWKSRSAGQLVWNAD